MICASNACSSSMLGARASWNTGTPSLLLRYTPSSSRQCRWIFRLAAEPKRWMSVTGNQPALLPHLPRPYRSERSGLVANNGFHSRGVS